MTESEKWDQGVAALIREYEGFSPFRKETVDRLAAAIKSCKESLHLIVEEVGASEICADCGGECCKHGKNHFRAIDLIIHLNDGRGLICPAFELKICPYMGDGGCTMGPEYRPYSCVTFICEKVEDLLGASEKGRFNAFERELRSLYREMEGLLDFSYRCPLLSVAERRNNDKSIKRTGSP